MSKYRFFSKRSAFMLACVGVAIVGVFVFNSFKASAGMCIPLDGSCVYRPSITIIKTVQGGDGTITPDMWSFTVSPAIGGQTEFTIPAGSDRVVIPDANEHTVYTVVENGVSGTESYVLSEEQSDNSSVNCSFSDSMAYPTVAIGIDAPAQDAVCNFVNVLPLELPTITLTKQVEGGDRLPSDWCFHITPAIGEGDGYSEHCIVGETNSVTIINVPDGDYVISEVGPTEYILSHEASAESSTNCSFDGNAYVTVASGNPATSASCTFVNVYQEPEPTTGEVVVYKTVINDNDGTATVEDFSFNFEQIFDEPTAQIVTAEYGEGYASGVTTTVKVGNYQVEEYGPTEGYTATYSENCANGYVTVEAGQTAICFITNDDIGEGNGDDPGDNHEDMIFDEQVGDRNTTWIDISWQTTVPATSRVVWGTSSVTELQPCQEIDSENPDGTCLWGYEFTTVEDTTMTTEHTVRIEGLTPSTIYYFRPVSHASPEDTGIELMTETMAPTTGGGGTYTGGGSSAPATTPPQGVLGETITADPEPTTDPVTDPMLISPDPAATADAEAPQEVAGYTTLPEAGIDYSIYLWSLLLGALCFAGAGVLAGAKK